VGLVQGLDRAVIDEIQRVPQVLLAIKRSLDTDKRPGTISGPSRGHDIEHI
jgi:hypothetical protein